MTEPRFYVPTLDTHEPEVRLDDEEAHHLTRVLRLGAGARIRVFDGLGAEVGAEVVAITKTTVRARILEPVTAAPESPVALTLTQAVLKPDSMDHVVRDATMLGVTRIQPVITERTNLPARFSDAYAIGRWHRVAVASAKQCGRAVLPVFGLPCKLKALEGADQHDCRYVLVEPSAAGILPLSEPPPVAPPAASLLIGPEGGWSESELHWLAAQRWRAWSLGDLTLRAEAAPIAALAVLRWMWRASS
jgi:16S rRNA (uracil1498-N3)-methyltransferase